MEKPRSGKAQREKTNGRRLLGAKRNFNKIRGVMASGPRPYFKNHYNEHIFKTVFKITL